jgi:hypothetical protein
MPIPKVIYQTWKTKELPQDIKNIRENIRKRNKEYKMVLFDDADIEDFITREYSEDILNAYRTLNIGAGKADLWRYLILYKYGGVYLDIDSDIIANLDDLIKEDDTALITREKNPCVFVQWCLIFEAGHQILKKTIEKCIANILRRDHHDLCYITGPNVFTDAIVETLEIPVNDLYYGNDRTFFNCRIFNYDFTGFCLFKNNCEHSLYALQKHWRYERQIFKLKDHIKYLTVYRYDNKIRLGLDNDKGYVIAYLRNHNEYDCYFSLGIGPDESFSNDFLKLYSCESYAFNSTVDKLPLNFPPQMKYIPKNIVNYNDDKHTNLADFMEKFKNIFLKMDIEGGEIPWLLSVENDQLLHFKQIVIEIHGINDDSFDSKFEDKVKCFKKLSKTHYLIHAHGNNNGGVTMINNKPIPNVIELTYLRKSEICFIMKNTNELPSHYDSRNNTHIHELDLNFEPFRFTCGLVHE